MDNSYSITIRPGNPNIKTIKLTGQIPGEEWKKLLKFHDEGGRLLEGIKECGDLSVRFSWKFNRDDNTSRLVNTAMPKRRDLGVILHSLRPFILQKEPFEFRKTVNILNRYMKHEAMKFYFQFHKDMFSGKLQNGMQLIFGESLIVNSEKTLMIWLNAYEYHRDEDKQRFIDEIAKLLPKDLLKSYIQKLWMRKRKERIL